MSELMDQLREQIATALGVAADEIDVDDDLLDHGLDSVRVMTLVEGWRARGAEISFADLAEAPTIRGWASALERAGLVKR
ncbi:phosphopantetheine-binding protein [Pilimelia columellifera]|uniref:Carrier domain-containing protein n=1 Tax=Pilimelia columellifera subsp. columellifera TaxID=706583 RepID=A0ABN3N2U8_9ACTN